jgi:catechol 2,3-dioxygenase-like lactoylglutathione lyase family enzyme
MKRFHVHLSVRDLAHSVAFYSNLFGAEPTVRKDDYAKWMIDEPRVNFAISSRGSGAGGLNHLGLQADDDDELEAIRAMFARADAEKVVTETGVACCYARSNKAWVTDPQGIAWEAFHSFDSAPTYDGVSADMGACCTTDVGGAVQANAACCGASAADPVRAASRASCC